MGKLTVKVPAIKTKDGTIVKATSKSQSHDDLGVKGERGFILSDGSFVGREKAAKVAKAVGEVKDPGKKLHSHELRKATKK